MENLNIQLTEPSITGEITTIFRNQRFTLRFPGNINTTDIDKYNVTMTYNNEELTTVYCNVMFDDEFADTLIIYPSMVLNMNASISLYISDIKYTKTDGIEYNSGALYWHFKTNDVITDYGDDFAPTIPIDTGSETRLPFEVVNTFPRVGTCNIPGNTIIELRFNKNIDTTLDISSYIVIEENNVLS